MEVANFSKYSGFASTCQMEKKKSGFFCGINASSPTKIR
jgi:hypothetical protein